MAERIYRDYETVMKQAQQFADDPKALEGITDIQRIETMAFSYHEQVKQSVAKGKYTLPEGVSADDKDAIWRHTVDLAWDSFEKTMGRSPVSVDQAGEAKAKLHKKTYHRIIDDVAGSIYGGLRDATLGFQVAMMSPFMLMGRLDEDKYYSTLESIGGRKPEAEPKARRLRIGPEDPHAG